MKKWLLWIVFVLVGLIILVLFRFNSTEENKDLISVKNFLSIVVENEPLIIQKEFQGKVRSFTRRDIKFPVFGKLLVGEKQLQNGSVFSKDQILFRMDNRSLFFELKKMKEDFKNLLTETLDNYPQSLISEKSKWTQFASKISPIKILPEFPTFSSAEEKMFFEGISLSYQGIQKEESKMEDYFYFAPFSGKVESVNTRVNSLVKRNEAIAKIVSTSKYWLDLAVANKESNRYEVGGSYVFSNGNFSVNGICNKKISRSSSDSIALVFEIVPSEDFLVDSEMILASSFSDTLNSHCALIPKSALENSQVLVFDSKSLSPKKVVIQREEEDSIWVSGLSNGGIISVEYFFADSSTVYHPIKR